MSTVSGPFMMFLGQRQQFFTWKCDVRGTWNAKLATTLCNLAVSTEEEIPPPNIGPLRIFLRCCRNVPAYQLCRYLMWQIFLPSQHTCNSIWGYIILYNFQKVAPLNQGYFKKNTTGDDRLHLEMQVTLNSRFIWTRKGWLRLQPYHQSHQMPQPALGGQTSRWHCRHLSKAQQKPSTSFLPWSECCRWCSCADGHNAHSLSPSSWKTPGTARKRLEVVGLPLRLKGSLREDLEWQRAMSPQSQLWTKVQGEAK